MTQIRRIKRVASYLVVMVVLGVGSRLLRAAGMQLIARTHGAPASAVFTDAAAVPITMRSVVRWRPDQLVAGSREMEAGTREGVANAYAQAWVALGHAARHEVSDSPLDTYLSGGLLARALALRDGDAARSGLEGAAVDADVGRRSDAARVDLTADHLAHELVLTYYSDDGAVVALEVPRAVIARLIVAHDPDGTPGQTVRLQTEERYRTVMVLEDGYWRMRLLERLASLNQP